MKNMWPISAPEGQLQKKGTPTMGGIIILLSILVPILLFGDLTNTNVLLLILTTVWLGALGFIWATVVLLGGFAITLERVDFWCVTVILLVEGARIFSRQGLLAPSETA